MADEKQFAVGSSQLAVRGSHFAVRNDRLPTADRQLRRAAFASQIVASRRALCEGLQRPPRKSEAEGGCGVIGIACSDRIAGRHLLQALAQMRNRGNGKGGGIAAAGLDPAFFGVTQGTLDRDHLLAIALLDRAAQPEVERRFIEPTFVVDHMHTIAVASDTRRELAPPVPPPHVVCYFVRVRPEVRREWMREHDVAGAAEGTVDDEIVYQNTHRLNRAFYASAGEKKAFVLSHARDLLVLKMVGYGEDVVRLYGLERLGAHVWIGHHRYPTKGRVWHPGGAHPFIGLNEALVHNGDFANYASITAYLAQRNIYPLFLTDTEVAALVFDLLYRVYGYPLEYVIEAMAPTTERDFALLPPDRRRIYQMLQAVHMHGSPDGPWFFLLAQSEAERRTCRLIGITDTSMLRPQVFALQSGQASIGFAASERQAIDAALESLAAEDPRFWTRADLYWNARGGSHTDGGAFLFTVQRCAATHSGSGSPASGEDGGATLTCTDKFGRVIAADAGKLVPGHKVARSKGPEVGVADAASADEVFAQTCRALPQCDYDALERWLAQIEHGARTDESTAAAIDVLTRLIDRRAPAGRLKRSAIVSLAEAALARVFARLRDVPSRAFVCAWGASPAAADPLDPQATFVVDSKGLPAEGEGSLARVIVSLCRRGARRLILTGTRGHRFIGCGLGADSDGVRLDIYGSPGDYLASGIDGAEVIVHSSGQDQLGQIMKRGRLVVHGDVGQTFMYGAKGGSCFVLGDAAGRPLINAVGRPRVVINGTCLDYLAESFMAGDALDGGGFVIVNGVRFDESGELQDLETAYPGGNLFSLASGGALYMRDPHGRLDDDQLNGGAFTDVTAADWALIRPYLEENARLFGIPVERLLQVDGRSLPPAQVYRKIVPAGHEALAPEEAWVRNRT